MLTIQNLVDEAIQLERQVEAAANMLQQSAGALQFVRNKIAQLQAIHDEAAKKALEEQGKNDDETNSEGAVEAAQE